MSLNEILKDGLPHLRWHWKSYLHYVKSDIAEQDEEGHGAIDATRLSR